MTRAVAMLLLTGAFLGAGNISAQEPQEGVFYRIKNVNSKRVLALSDGTGKADDPQIVQRAHGKDERQPWRFV